jgi:hypothetical protein
VWVKLCKWAATAAAARGSGSEPELLLLVFPEIVHVQVTVRLEPVLVRLDSKCSPQAQTAFRVGEDPYRAGPPLDLFVEALQHVGRLQVLVVAHGRTVEGRGLLDVVLDPIAELRVSGLPPGQPRRQVLLRLAQPAPVPPVRLCRPEGRLPASAAPAGSRRWPGAAGDPGRSSGNARSGAAGPPRGAPRGSPPSA